MTFLFSVYLKIKMGIFFPFIEYKLSADNALKKAIAIKTLLISNKLLIHHAHGSYVCILI